MSALPNPERVIAHPAVHALPDPPRTRELSPGDCIAGRYRIDDIIGRGGMATVYRGYDERLRRDVAIKVRDTQPGEPQPPLQEEQVSSRLLHANIVSIFDAGQVPEDEPGAGSTFIVMEYVDGTTAHAIAPVHWTRAVEIMRDVADGLAHAHAHGVVHCDVTPGNVLIDSNGRALLADFGVAVEADTEADDFVHGSPSYIAPERVHGEKADARVDVYGLGGVFAYLLTGKHPQQDAPLDLPERCPAVIRDIIHRARARNPDARFADARAFAAALDEAPDLIARGDGDLAHLRADAVTLHVPVARDPAASASTVRSGSVSPDATAAQEDEVMTLSEEVVDPLRSQRRSVYRARTIAAAVLALALAVLVADAVLFDAEPVTAPPAVATTAVEMPDVSNMTFAEALGLLSEQGISVSRVDVVYGPGPLNQVVAQEPAPGEEIDGAAGVNLVVRTGR